MSHRRGAPALVHICDVRDIHHIHVRVLYMDIPALPDIRDVDPVDIAGTAPVPRPVGFPGA